MFSQTKDDTLQAVKNTIENYYNGYIFRNYTLLEKAFDTENGTMKVPVLKDEKVIGFENHFFKDLIQKWGNREQLSEDIIKNCALTILNIDIVDQKIASAKISMKVDTITYIDILSLQKINQNWKITNKIFVIEQ
ncbi:MAG: nuclear transport factor 2 family protein [Polaribacter sp.]|nr:nuclear transport factor 2 family protein [Polaribacter sp.]